ncbi:hypothetical protein LAZ67_21001517 [Cordylochernes scorpioides]|uniref:Uncharacterized protein n=1 Tax=Cordylochernes scorpioides TaxID=51811 RepID=A0ABY6LM35_9ARAC|nr:hypothetical protein LAZ67_21001517 [Cordylochernes scorpioides]
MCRRMDELAVVYVRRVLMIFPHADNKKQRQGYMLAHRGIGDSPRDRGRGHDTNLDAYHQDMERETQPKLFKCLIKHSPKRTIVFEWHSRFKAGRISIVDDLRQGRPKISKD